MAGAELFATYQLTPPLTLDVEGCTVVGLLGLYGLQQRGSVRLRSWGFIGLVGSAITAGAVEATGQDVFQLVVPFLLILPVSLAAVLLSWREMLLVTLVAIIDAYWLYLVSVPAASLLRQQHWTTLLSLLLTISLVLAAIALITILTKQQSQHILDERQGLYAALQEKEHYQAQLLAQLLTAQEGERQRLAHDLHDGPLQDLSVLLLTLESCRRQITACGPAPVLTDLQQAYDLGDAIFVTLRSLMSDLRPPTLDTIGLVAALNQVALQETTFRVALSTQLAGRLAPPLETLVFRLVQEGLANIRKHAHAQHARIRVADVPEGILLQIRDDGQGFAVEGSQIHALATGHLGLASMQERVAAVGGHLVIESSPDGGTTLSFAIPSPRPPVQRGTDQTSSPPGTRPPPSEAAPRRALPARPFIPLRKTENDTHPSTLS